ncbi:hypothetical protein FACS189430_02220 [Bacteroidia bacterium]|nr:hypothetical protein FACS189430_02220 [Bacteroidia bacterium]
MKSLKKRIDLLKSSKNIILTGAPGVGKTYTTAEIAVAVCDGTDNLPTNRTDLMKRYKELIDSEQIVFTTFHQSLDYEEFIEGLKPEINEETKQGTGNYSIKDGIFKQICIKANNPIIVDQDFQIGNNATIWKVSLQGTGDNEVRTDCMSNNRIRIGWDQYGENIDEDTKYERKSSLDAFIDKMKIGDIVMSCYTQKIVDAIGVVTGEYEWNNGLASYKRSRTVNWLVKNIKEDIYDLNNQTVMSQRTVYRLNNMSLENIMSILNKYTAIKKEIIQKNTKPYILIIDEINRGNISKIFGELITLLEKDKRIGEENEITVRLPYSQKKFGVSSNLYIIGTMNTADRSIGQIDYALRRRFAFVSLQAKGDLITATKAKETFLEIRKLIENRINSDLDADDIMIGHSYFMDNFESNLEYQIIPLLLEYDKDGLITLEEKERKLLKKGEIPLVEDKHNPVIPTKDDTNTESTNE